MLSLINDGQGGIANLNALTQVLQSNSGLSAAGNNLRAVQPIGGGPAIISSPGNSGAIAVRTTIQPAAFQTDKLPIVANAGATFYTDLGEIKAFIDTGGVAAPTIEVGDVIMLTPDGVLHDLAVLTTFRDGFAQGLPQPFPPGRYGFIVKAGEADASIYVQHVGAKNLI